MVVHLQALPAAFLRGPRHAPPGYFLYIRVYFPNSDSHNAPQISLLPSALSLLKIFIRRHPRRVCSRCIAHGVLVEQRLAQLLVHNPNECGSDWAAVVEE